MTTDTIMVIDDDQDLREGIVEILEGNNFSVIACESAEKAMQKIRIEVPRLIIVDNMMPGMGGMAFMPLVKNDYPRIKIIMITAFSTVDNAVAAMKSGADDYLAKPFKRDELLVAVRRNLEVLKFEQQLSEPDMDETLSSLSNPIRRQILAVLSLEGEMRFMDITRHLGISDHTKVNFHLKNLKACNLVSQDRDKSYCLTSHGVKMVDYLHLLSQKIS
ncbi:MAG: response regulator [Proteobacteria bacterium]|nr:response regulator [Pseudomonadota bacterium]